MTSRITTAWSTSDELVTRWAAFHAEATFTAIRDIYGRCSFAVENLDPDTLAMLSADVRDNAPRAARLHPAAGRGVDRSLHSYLGGRDHGVGSLRSQAGLRLLVGA